MGDSDVITIFLYLPPDEAAVLARLSGRVDRKHFRCIDPTVDTEVALSATTRLLGALVGAGFTADGRRG